MAARDLGAKRASSHTFCPRFRAVIFLLVFGITSLTLSDTRNKTGLVVFMCENS